MTNAYTFQTEAESRAFWQHLCAQMGIERACAQCSIKLVAGVYTISVRHGEY